MENPNAQSEIAAYLKFDQDIPETLFPPDLHDIEEHVWEAFWNLSTDRPVGMGPGQIPWSSISKMGEEFKAMGEKTFHRLIRAMDATYLGHKTGEKKTFSRSMMRG